MACHSVNMTPPSIEELSQKIERLIEEHLAETRAAVMATIHRALSAPVQAHSGRERATRKERRPATSSVKSTGRRASTEVAELAERLHQVVCANPGESMAFLALEVGATPRQLERPMGRLKQTGRVRRTGARIHARYFPTTLGLKPSA